MKLLPPNRTRLALLVMLIPLLVLGVWIALQDLTTPALDWRISRDGRFLWTVHTQRIGLPATWVKLWDLDSRLLLRSQRLEGATTIALSLDERTLAVGAADGTLHTLDANTLKLCESVRTQQTIPVYPFYFLTDKLLAIGDDLNQFKLLRLPRLEVVQEIPSVNARRYAGMISKDRRTLLLETERTSPRRYSTTVYRWDGKKLRAFFTWDGDVRVFRVRLADNGRAAFVVTAVPDANVPEVTRYAIPSGEKQWVKGLSDGFRGAELIQDGKVLVTAHRGVVRLWDAESGAPLGSWPAPDGFELMSYRLAVNQSGLAVEFNRRPLRVRNLMTGEIKATLPMSKSAFFSLLSAVGVLFAIWSGLWIHCGHRQRDWHPLTGVAVIHAIMFFGLLVRYLSSGGQTEVMRPVAILTFAQLIAWTSLAGFWASMSANRWLLRAAVFLVCLALVFGLLQNVWGVVHFIWEIAVGSLGFLIFLVGGLQALRLRGLHLRFDDGVERKPADSRVHLADVLVFMGASCVFFAVARFASPVSLAAWGITFVLVDGAFYALAAGAGIWLALGTGDWRWRAFLCLPVAVVSGLAPTLLFLRFPIFPWWWYLASHLSVATHVTWTLTVFRLWGYRLRFVF